MTTIAVLDANGDVVYIEGTGVGDSTADPFVPNHNLKAGATVTVAGGATEATLAAQSAKLPAALGSGGGLKIDGSGFPIPVNGTVAVSGGATETTQAAGNVLSGAVAETAPATDTASSGLNGRLQRIAQRLTSLIALLPAALGSGGGLKVDGSGTALPVSGTVGVTGVATETTLAAANVLQGAVTETAPATDTASSGLNGRLQRIAQRLTSLIALFPTALGGTTAANSFPVVLSSDGPFTAQTGAVTETAPATDTASSGLNGRLQRIAQRLTSMIALLPAALGQGTMAQGLRVVLPSDQAAIPTSSKGYTSGKVSVTRTADTNVYAANDVLGPATGSTAAITFPSMGPAAGGEIIITSASFERDAAALISGETSYILHLYNVTPPSALGDNGAFDLPSGDRASYLGSINLGTPSDLGSTLYVATDAINKQVTVLSGGSLFGYLVTVGTYTPVSAAVHLVTLHSVGT